MGIRIAQGVYQSDSENKRRIRTPNNSARKGAGYMTMNGIVKTSKPPEIRKYINEHSNDYADSHIEKRREYWRKGYNARKQARLMAEAKKAGISKPKKQSNN
jgi:hypothetical protein